jgi:hypothetical protein
MRLLKFVSLHCMKSKKNLAIFILAIVFSIFYACKKKEAVPEPEPVEAPTTGILRIVYENYVDDVPFKVNQKFVNPKADTFSLTKFNYYISNIVVTKTDNSTYTEPESYHLIDTNKYSGIINLTVPNGSYKSISFMIGVDSARNTSGAQEGALSPTRNMFWTWSSGYIMMKIEGTAPKSGAPNKTIEYHIGGFGGVNKTQRNFNLGFGGATANVNSSTACFVYLKTDVNEFFKTPTLIDFATQYSQTTAGSGAKMYADNYADMITFKKVQN